MGISRDPGGGFGGLDGPCAALHGLVDVDLIPGKVDVFPEEGGGLPRAKAGVEDGENPQPRGMGLGQGQDVPPLLVGDGPVGPLHALRQLEPLCRVIEEDAGPPGLAEELLHHHAQLGHVGVGPPRLGVQDGLQVEVPHLGEFQVPHGGADVTPVFLVIKAETFGGEARWRLVGVPPLGEPLVHGEVAPGQGQVPLLQGGDEVGQLVAGLLLRLAPHLIAVVVPGDGLSNVTVLFHKKSLLM